MNQIIRVGIIGAGAIARDVHIPNYLKLGNKVEIVAITDIVKEKALELADQYNIKYVFEDFQTMFNKVELDAVSVCTPNKFHFGAVMAALKAGCHVLCEKPPAMNVREAERMENTSNEAGKILSYGLCYRYTAEVQTLKRMIDAGELGEIYAARVHALRRRGIPGWGVFTNKELQGGGALIDLGVHMLDTALYLMGYPEPDIVFGVTYKNLGTKKGVGMFGEWDWENFSVEDMARVMITLKNGASIILETSFAANIKSHEEMSVALMGDKGGADVFPLQIYEEKHDALFDMTPSFLLPRDKFEEQFKTFINNCLNNSNVSNKTDGVILQKIINGVYESASKGVPIKLA
ncbi:Gfo/Idh/MocA family protein [Oceanobacillus neutriphilus]|uniref:Oxidoreductase n=1 Tax=Oceanobacillus neutriphilus TaxID=531815 RepID=A0ABQ2NRX1_9BACI|nr:Gfo/Idh/MocA family oxidoreductase [Oceanobacillus neutriphilus]GGP10276.1 oxidoreductase [Oceanobacillus neutriphilus]